MSKKVLVLSVIAVLAIFTACTKDQKNVETQETPAVASIEVSIDSLIQNAANYQDVTIVTSGTVSHVCRESGQKLFIMGTDPEKLIKVTTGGNISRFDIALEGSKIQVTGKLINETTLAPADSVKAPVSGGGIACSTEGLTMYSIECAEFKEL